MADEQQQQPAHAPPPTNAQVYSALAQNFVVAGIVAYAWLGANKLDTVTALPALLFVVGVDLIGRKRLPGANALLLGLGATGVLDLIYHLPIISGLVLYFRR
jgi:hypothetical protein